MTRAKYKAIFAVCVTSVILIFEAVIYFCGTDSRNYISKSVLIADIVGIALNCRLRFRKKVFRQQIKVKNYIVP